MSVDPRISVVIPSYNGAAYLAEALESVLAQTYPVAEILLIDDGSTDNTAAVVQPYLDKVRYIRQDNGGLPVARNTGLDRATGDWVAFLDSDDVWKPHKLARQVERIRREDGLTVVHSGFAEFGSRQGESVPPAAMRRGEYDMEAVLTHFLILPSTVLVRHDTSVRFRPWATRGEDKVYYLDLLERGARFAYVDEALTGYRRHAGALTSQADCAIRSYDCMARWVEESESLPAARKEGLLRTLLQGVAEEVRLARWARDWPRYWRLRAYLRERWRWPDPPEVLGERVYPRVFYRLKDALDGLLRRGTRAG